MPSPTSITEEAEGASLMPKPMAIGKSVCFRSSLTFLFTSFESMLDAPVMPFTDM